MASGSSAGSKGVAETPFLNIAELRETLVDDAVLQKFREYLRALDGKSKAAPEMKGRFERYLDFIRSLQAIYDLPADDRVRQGQLLTQVRADYFTCVPSKRLSVTSQVALKQMSDHLRVLHEHPDVQPNLQLTRPVFEDAYRKMQQKHDLFKKSYKPSMSLHTLLCLLS